MNEPQDREQATRQGQDLLNAMMGASPSIVDAPGAAPFNRQAPPEQSDPRGTSPGAGEIPSTPDPMSFEQDAAQFAAQKAEEEEGYVPKKAHMERISRMGRKNEKLEGELTALRAQIAELRAASRPTTDQIVHEAMTEVPVDGEEDMSTEERQAKILAVALDKALKAQESGKVADLERRLEDLDNFRGLSREQSAVVKDIRDLYPGVNNPEKILNLAKLEAPELFLDTANHGGTSFAGKPGRGSEGEQAPQEPTGEQVAEFLFNLPDDDPRKGEAGPFLIKHQMDQDYPGVHGRKY